MNLLYAAIAFIFAIVLILAGVTRVGTWLIERRNLLVGAYTDVEGVRIHNVHVPVTRPAAELPPVVFIHGASANLNDQMVPLRPLLEGRAELLFFDRPGLGWSERGAGHGTPDAQAKVMAGLMDRYEIDRAIIVAHSFGGSIAAAFALSYPERTAGLVFVSAATHPWPGGKTSWYYPLAKLPVVGWMFAQTLAYPAGITRIAAATECVFAPNPTPEDYVKRASIELVLRPSAFRANAVDVESLYPFALANQRRYGEIKAPTVVISGDSDTVVYEEIHSLGLERDIPGAELVWIRNLGHKPDWIAPELIVAAVEKMTGKPLNLQAMGQSVEARIAGDRQGAGARVDEKPADGELAPLSGG
jgi:pimeloyl-ACP methyl ester carboxylesterase